MVARSLCQFLMLLDFSPLTSTARCEISSRIPNEVNTLAFTSWKHCIILNEPEICESSETQYHMLSFWFAWAKLSSFCPYWPKISQRLLTLFYFSTLTPASKNASQNATERGAKWSPTQWFAEVSTVSQWQSSGKNVSSAYTYPWLFFFTGQRYLRPLRWVQFLMENKHVLFKWYSHWRQWHMCEYSWIDKFVYWETLLLATSAFAYHGHGWHKRWRDATWGYAQRNQHTTLQYLKTTNNNNIFKCELSCLKTYVWSNNQCFSLQIAPLIHPKYSYLHPHNYGFYSNRIMHHKHTWT